MKENKKSTDKQEEVKENVIKASRFEVEQLLNPFIGNIKITNLSKEDKIKVIKLKLELSKVTKEIEDFRKTTVESLDKPENFDKLKEAAEKEGASEEDKKAYREVEAAYNTKFSEVAIPYYNTYIDIKADHISEEAFFSIVEDNNMDMAVFSYEQLYKQLVNK